ncbi:MAG: 16S rRNA (guanine(527)-N(7))-methyltransferase RsmG [Endomicrobium sp.]|jgi:16S rRNA (guanine527-N7)-methyltransferase|nr:16S rRNA (guanine(527)-N(7))-methyltransferase RsmG [Endomicrobium sp.]
MKKEKLFFNEFQKYVSDNIINFISQKMKEKFEVYFYELIEWNKFLNLISFKNEKNLIYRHFCDSLYSAKIISDITGNKDTVLKTIDIGTGSGMPGIPVKIVLPSIKMTLIESITKKCKFLENVNRKLGLYMEILNSRAEEIGQKAKYRQQYDFVLSRAVSKLSPNLEISIPLLKVGGYFIVHKTKKSTESAENGLPSVENALKHLETKLEQVISYNLPEQKLDYCILVFKKYKDTQAHFPRKSGVPEKKPL